MVGRRAVERAILDGVQIANKRYEKWSRGGWLSDSGIEGHVVSTVGEKLHGLIAGRGSIQMEVPFGDIRERCNAEPSKGRPRVTTKARNRADIVIIANDGRPACVIELKRTWDKTKCFNDLIRTRNLILRYGPQKTGPLKMGFVAFLLEGWETADMTAEQCLRAR